MASIGLAMFEANKMYNDQKYLDDQHDAWRADAPLREAERAKKIDEAQQYFAPGAVSERQYLDRQKKDVADNYTLLEDHRKSILDGPAGFAQFLTKVEKLDDGSYYDAAGDANGYEGGLTVVRRNSAGEIIPGSQRTIPEIKDGKTALLATRAHILGAKQAIDEAQTQALKQAERAHDINKITAEGQWHKEQEAMKQTGENARTAASLRSAEELARIKAANDTQRVILDHTMKGAGTEVDKISAGLAGLSGVDNEGNPFIAGPAGEKVYLDHTNPAHVKKIEDYQNYRLAIGSEIGNGLSKGVITSVPQATMIAQQKAKDIQASNYINRLQSGAGAHKRSNAYSAVATPDVPQEPQKSWREENVEPPRSNYRIGRDGSNFLK